MNPSNEFLEYLTKLFHDNPNSIIDDRLIYSILTRHNAASEGKKTLPKQNLVNVQLDVKKHLENNPKAIMPSHKYFLWMENRPNQKDKSFLVGLYNSIKLYVAIEPEEMSKYSKKILDFMYDNDIAMQSKISKDLRNDELVIRVLDYKDATKVIDYINSLDFKASITPAPFTLNKGKVSCAMDGGQSYNETVSRMLSSYLNDKRNNDLLYTVSPEDFIQYIQKPDVYEKYCMIYNIMDLDEKEDLALVVSQMRDNLRGTLTLDKLRKMQKARTGKPEEEQFVVTPELENNYIRLVSAMSNKYNAKDTLDIIEEYIISGNERLFTRTSGIRNYVINKFNPKSLASAMKEVGWKTFEEACDITYKKYNHNQAIEAINRLFQDENISFFTNDNNVRSRLGLLISPEMLKEEIFCRTGEKDGEKVLNILMSMAEEKQKKTNRQGR